ncbi:NAD(P)/FAD-dependent oxidoreductase [Chthonobacter albigriseus]|uniref:NAD(P)/FAD-dependent oxidoreductase n=1 Tax=Chthonobacter albigriseus TaxID=1683161 RepID=UPI0015EEC322|nr:NAD(P)/FAD-dependent oxidoreductase [Chthonobacter albigriseus]
MKREHADVAIIGAGPAGLTSAYQLAKAGVSTITLEADPVRVGGISRTVDYKGFLFDIGGHRFFSKSQEIVALWDELLPDDFIERPRMSRIYYNDRFYSYPLNAFEALNNLGYAESVHCVLSFLKSQVFPHHDPATFHQWVANQFGERLFSIFFKTYTEKVWGMSCDDISADWAAQRIKGLDLWSAMANALRNSIRPQAVAEKKDGEVIKTLIQSFRYPRKGPGMMWDAAARRVREMGGAIEMGTTLTGLSHDPRRGLWSLEGTRADGSKTRYTAHDVISSAPIRELIGMLDLPAEAHAAAERLKYRDFITVALVVDRPDLFPDNWIYIHEPKVKVGRIQNFRSWSPEMVPDASLSCLGLEYFCFEGDGLWTATDEDLLALARRELAEIGLASEAECVDGCVVRQKKAYPVYDETYKASVETIRGHLEARYPSLHLVGRNGMHKYNNQDHAMMTGILTAKNIIAGEPIYDVWGVNEDAEYHEAGESGAEEALKSVRMVPERLRRSA